MSTMIISKHSNTTNTGIDIDAITSDEYQEQQAESVKVTLFAPEVEDVGTVDTNATNTLTVMRSVLESYEQHKHDLPITVWLQKEFGKYPDIWQNQAEIETTATDLIKTLTIANAKKAALHAHLQAGQSQSSWLATEIENSAGAAGVVQVGAFAGTIDTALIQANELNIKAITRLDGAISQARNLDGFIAEHHHANTFNLEAAAQGKPYTAKVLEPAPGQTYGKNSMDIGIYDADGKLVRRYQSKYGADADATTELFERGNYRGQRKLVPEGHSDSTSAEAIEFDGVNSKPLSKEEAKALQERAQQQSEAKQYEWKDTNRLEITKQIGRQALIAAGITAGLQGARILGRRLWNSLRGEANPTVSEDLEEFFVSTLSGAGNIGVQVAVSGGLIIAVKNGWLAGLAKNTPAGLIANIAFVGLENAKVLFKLAQGKLSREEALDAMGRTTTLTITTLAASMQGAALGASIGVVLGPIGAAVGSFVGAVAGGIAGSTIGEAIYEGGKAVCRTAFRTVKDLAIAGREALSTATEYVGEKLASAWDWLTS